MKKNLSIFILGLIVAMAGVFAYLRFHTTFFVSSERCDLRFVGVKEGCLYDDGDGTIYVRYIPPAGDSVSKVVVRAVNKWGRSAVTEIPGALERVLRDPSSGQISIETMIRGDGVDQIIKAHHIVIVDLEKAPPEFTTIIDRPGFAFNQGGIWQFVPYEESVTKNSDLVYENITVYGPGGDTWAFGKELVAKADWNNNSKLLWADMVGNDMMLTFGGSCGADTPYVPCQRYLLDLVAKKVLSVEKTEWPKGPRA